MEMVAVFFFVRPKGKLKVFESDFLPLKFGEMISSESVRGYQCAGSDTL